MSSDAPPGRWSQGCSEEPSPRLCSSWSALVTRCLERPPPLCSAYFLRMVRRHEALALRAGRDRGQLVDEGERAVGDRRAQAAADSDPHDSADGAGAVGGTDRHRARRQGVERARLDPVGRSRYGGWPVPGEGADATCRRRRHRDHGPDPARPVLTDQSLVAAISSMVRPLRTDCGAVLVRSTEGSAASSRTFTISQSPSRPVRVKAQDPLNFTPCNRNRKWPSSIASAGPTGLPCLFLVWFW